MYVFSVLPHQCWKPAIARCVLPCILLILLASVGCYRTQEQAPVAGGSDDRSSSTTVASPNEVTKQLSPALQVEPQSYEVSAEELLAARLPAEEVSEGWIRLFDGYTLFGWEIAGAANFRVEEGSIVVDSGDVCLLCTSIPWRDYELVVEFKAQQETNSGVFLRTQLDPPNVETDCFEVNIAPDDNPFPTGGIVKRQQAKSDGKPQPVDTWRTMKMRVEGNQVQVTLDDELVCDYTDTSGLETGRIGLQHNSGRVEFRNVLLRPLGMKSLLDAQLSAWKQYPEMDAKFTVTEEGYLHVEGGSGQLESKESFGDFLLLADYKLPTHEINSGIFFRCIPGDKMMGYECQLSNQMKDGNRLIPADCGTGGIFRRQDARVVAGDDNEWASVLLAVDGASMAAWVNGVQVSNWYDDRQADDNPRKGRRTDPGTLMIQGHDPQTDALLRQIQVVTYDATE